jgi:hypothetical protein
MVTLCTVVGTFHSQLNDVRNIYNNPVLIKKKQLMNILEKKSFQSRLVVRFEFVVLL